MFEFVQDGVEPLFNTKRWGTYHTINEESVAEHVFEVTNIAYLIAKQVDKADEHVVLEKSLFHDLEEAGTGDIPRWTKRMNGNFERGLEELEKDIVNTLVDDFDKSFASDMKDIWENSKDDTVEGKIVACADIISAINGVRREENLGNTALAKDSNIERGIEYAKEVCYGIPPAEQLLNDILDDMGCELMVTSDIEIDDIDGDLRITYFTAEWCGPCSQQKPIVKEFVEENDIQYREVDVEQNKKLAGKHNIRSLPTIMVDDGENIIDKIVGVTPPEEIESAI